MTFSPESHDPNRTSHDLVARRYGKAIADLSLAVVRLSQGIADGRFTRDGRLAAETDVRMPGPDAGPIENDVRMGLQGLDDAESDVRMASPMSRFVDNDVRIPPAGLARRRRGGQPGNTNRLSHGRRRRRPRLANREDKALLVQARRLCDVIDVMERKRPATTSGRRVRRTNNAVAA